MFHFLKQGISPQKLALAVSFGVIIGIFPVIGTCTLLGILIATLLKLNMAALQLVNYFMYPLQILLFVPFIRLGEFVFRVPSSLFSLGELTQSFQTNFVVGLQTFGSLLLIGVVGWFIVAVPLFIALYFILLTIFKKLKPTKQKQFWT